MRIRPLHFGKIHIGKLRFNFDSLNLKLDEDGSISADWLWIGEKGVHLEDVVLELGGPTKDSSLAGYLKKGLPRKKILWVTILLLFAIMATVILSRFKAETFLLGWFEISAGNIFEFMTLTVVGGSLIGGVSLFRSLITRINQYQEKIEQISGLVDLTAQAKECPWVLRVADATNRVNLRLHIATTKWSNSICEGCPLMHRVGRDLNVREDLCKARNNYKQLHGEGRLSNLP